MAFCPTPDVVPCAGVGSTYSIDWDNYRCSGGDSQRYDVADLDACRSSCSSDSSCVAFMHLQRLESESCWRYTTVPSRGSYNGNRRCAIKRCGTATSAPIATGACVCAAGQCRRSPYTHARTHVLARSRLNAARTGPSARVAPPHAPQLTPVLPGPSRPVTRPANSDDHRGPVNLFPDHLFAVHRCPDA